MIVAGHQILSTDLKPMGLQMREWISRLMRGENTLIYPSISSPLSLPPSSCLLLSLSRVPTISLHSPPATVLMTTKHFPLHILPDLEMPKAPQQKEAVKGAKSSVSPAFSPLSFYSFPNSSSNPAFWIQQGFYKPLDYSEGQILGGF